MVERNVTVTSQAGLHARPVSIIAALLKGYPGTAELIWGDKSANLNNMLELLAMAVPANAVVTIRVNGQDEERVADDLVMIIKTMDEPGAD